MFGLVESGGMEWSGMGYKHIPLFVFVKSEWNGMELDGTHSIQYHSVSVWLRGGGGETRV
jgi:hypothetical protein